MSESLDHEDPIEEVAADWLTLRAEGFSSTQKRDFERWCRADPRHATAVARLEAACALLEKMPLVRAELQPVVEFPAAARVPRRGVEPVKKIPVLRVACAMAAAVALLVRVGATSSELVMARVTACSRALPAASVATTVKL